MKVERIFEYDRFIGESDINNKDFGYLRDFIDGCESLLDDISTKDADDEGLIIGVKGDWGTGKTSLMKAVESYFLNFRRCPTVFFQAWKYQEEENPIIPLLIKMRDVTEKDKDIREKLTDFIKRFIKASYIISLDILLKALSSRVIGEAQGIEDKDETPLLHQIKLSIFIECFPKSEKILRGFPDIKEKIFEEDYEELKKRRSPVKEIIETAEKDNSFFRFPEENLKNILKVEGRV